MSGQALYDTSFKQQRLPAIRTRPLSPTQVAILAVAIGVVAAGIGAVVFVANQGVIRYELPYPTDCSIGGRCRIQFQPDRDLPGPVYFYYKISGMYQNHRRYVKSKSSDQLQGLDQARTGQCQPLERDGDLILYPCGLIAASYFRDRIDLSVLINGQRQPGNWSSDSILTDHDRSYYQRNALYEDKTRFKSTVEAGGRQVQLPPVTDPDLITWMHTAPLPTFTKLYRVRGEDIKANSLLTFDIENLYDVSSFDGRKSLLISTMSFLGGRQTFMAWAWIGLACACFLFGAAVYIADRKMRVSPRLISVREIA